MKKSLTHFTILAGTACLLFSCQKVNTVSEELDSKGKKNKDLCLISSFSYSNSFVPVQTIFTNRFDLSGRSLEVEAGVYSGGTIVSSKLLSIKWLNSGLAFVDANAVTDTILIASFDRKGRIEKIVPGNARSQDFLPTSFQYINNRIASMGITLAGNTETVSFDYDLNGNVISISDAPSTSVPIPGKVEYEYVVNEKAKKQFYFDEPRKFSWNSFTLLQYIGLFPELQPVNLRKSTKVMWGNNYQAYHMNITNQQIDQQGKLVSYDVVSPSSGNVVSHYNINWTCNQDIVQSTGNN